MRPKMKDRTNTKSVQRGVIISTRFIVLGAERSVAGHAFCHRKTFISFLQSASAIIKAASLASSLPAAAERAVCLHYGFEAIGTGICEVEFGGEQAALGVEHFQIAGGTALEAFEREGGDIFL